MPRFKARATVLSLATLFVTAAFGQNAISARPGTLNYIEGQATINGQELSAKSVGKTELGAGQTIETRNGKAEVLLTPGVFLRLDENSAVRMISPDLTHTEVQVDRGRAQVEVDQLYKQNNIVVSAGSSRTQLLKQGLYSFDADSGHLRVFDGKAAVLPDSPADNEKPITVKGGKQLALNGDLTKPQRFDRDRSEDALFKWSSLRSQYLGEANVQLASQYAGTRGFNPGWYWNTGLYSYTWLPGGGPYFSPFGYGFYSPSYLYGGGSIYGYPGGYPGGFYNGGAYRGGIYRNGTAWRGGNTTGQGGQIYRGGAPSGAGHGGIAGQPGGAAMGGSHSGASISNGGMSRGGSGAGSGGGMSRGGGGGHR